MKNKIIIFIVLIFFILNSGCNKSGDDKSNDNSNSHSDNNQIELNREYRCEDGTFTNDIAECDDIFDPVMSINPDSDADPVIEVLKEAETSVTSEDDAKNRFLEYIEEDSLDYEFKSVNFYKEENGIRYYKIKYQKAGMAGSSYILVDSEGRVLKELLLI